MMSLLKTISIWNNFTVKRVKEEDWLAWTQVPERSLGFNPFVSQFQVHTVQYPTLNSCKVQPLTWSSHQKGGITGGWQPRHVGGEEPRSISQSLKHCFICAYFWWHHKMLKTQAKWPEKPHEINRAFREVVMWVSWEHSWWCSCYHSCFSNASFCCNQELWHLTERALLKPEHFLLLEEKNKRRGDKGGPAGYLVWEYSFVSDFPHGPVAETPLTLQGPQFHPWSGT